MVLLHFPFRNEETDILDCNKFIQIYELNEEFILEPRKEFESNINVYEIIEICRQLCIEQESEDSQNNNILQNMDRDKTTDNDFIDAMQYGNNADIIIGTIPIIDSIVKKRENVMSTEEYCKLMRTTNIEQRGLILEAIHRIFSNSNDNPIQIFLTGPAGCGKTFLMKLLMETFNRFSQPNNNNYNAYIASASTGMAASAIDGSTVHSVFRISNNNARRETGLSFEQLNTFRVAFNNISIVFIDECSMIGSGLLHQINSRLQQVLHNFDVPFGNINVIICGDLRQLPPVCQSPIYKRTRSNLSGEIIWQSLQFYPLNQVMRQNDISFSSTLTKIGDGISLEPEEKSLIESRFFQSTYVNEHFPNVIRLFSKTSDVIQYNNQSISGDDVIQYVAKDVYTGHKNTEQLASARNKVHKLKTDETGGLPYMLKLQLGKPYMIRANIDVDDGLVNGAIGTLCYIERDNDQALKRLWLSFNNVKIGKLLRIKCAAFVLNNPNLESGWTPISLSSTSINLKSKIIQCKRKQFPLVESCAITIHKSQGGTYEIIVYEYHKSHEQQLVYVALSRVTSLNGLYITNSISDHNFYHARGKNNRELRNEFSRLNQHKLKTISESCREFLSLANSSDSLTLCSINVQSLRAHFLDLSSDFVMTKVMLLMLNETWMTNDVVLDIPGFELITQFKRSSVRVGGVAIYANKISPIIRNASRHKIFKLNPLRIVSSHEEFGDYWAAEIKIEQLVVLVISVYFNPKTTLNNMKSSLELNLMAYSPKSAIFNVVRQRGYDKIPVILCGDFNFNFKGEQAEDFLSFMFETFELRMQNNADFSTTRSNACIDGIFSRHLPQIQTMNFITYFSYHRPLLGIIPKAIS